MNSELLQRARDYERDHIPAVPPALLPRYHLCGGVGWINDPNGFSLYKGEYHLFFQYNPYDVRWDTMHWGHVKTRDFLRWERLPAALAPDRDYDRDGCFSGSALETPDGRHLLMYTGVQKTLLPDGTVEELQRQCLAFGDGRDYEKYPGNPVLDGSALPPGGSRKDFRDPKLWREGDGYFCVAGNRCPDGSGAVLLFQSPDALHWRYAATLAASGNRFGRMWECPDFFPLDGKRVLLLSPQEVRDHGPEFIDGNTTLCLIGELDPESGALTREREQPIDYGLDFYAPQTVLAADGRRVMIAWMQYWNSVDYRPEPPLPFFGQLTVPRELRVRDGKLYQTPVRELESRRGAAVRCAGLTLRDETRQVPGVSGRCLDLLLTICPLPGETLRRFTLTLAAAGEHGLRLHYEPDQNTVTVDRSGCGLPDSILNRRSFAVNADAALRLRLLLDRWSLELFVNDGEQAASFVLYAPQERTGIRFTAEGAAALDLEKYDLEFD
ncbi:MAG: glycoside hydrolase family 32 protein [Oscillospiraceae bacterium]|nr:glycoside hydrolase family 32 protein [Oscillospiraceae bacterium]